MNPARRDWWLIAGVAVMLLVLVVAGRLQGQKLVAGDAEVSRSARGTSAADDRPVAAGLALAGRMALPGPAAAVAVGEGAVWVLLQQGTLLRVDPDRLLVTGRLELGAPTGAIGAGPLAVGEGAVWVGTREGTVTVRIDPVRLRVTARFGGDVVAVAHGLLWSYCCPRGDRAMGFGRVDARTLRSRPPLRVTDTQGRRQPVGWLAVGADAVWTHAFEGQRLWRVPLAGGLARVVARVPGFTYGLAVDQGGVWVLSGTGKPGSGRDRSGRLRRLDQRTGEVTVTTPVPDLDVGGRDGVAVGFTVGGGSVWLTGPYSRGNGGVLLRVDPASGRVTGWLHDPLWYFQDVLAADPHGLWVASAAPELRHLVPG